MATKEIHINLETVLAAKREYLDVRKAKTPPMAMIALADMQHDPSPVLNTMTDGKHITLIGQIRLTESYDPVAMALRFVRSGVDAVSLFTDKFIYTQGMDDLLLVSRGVPHTPVVSQDFMLNEYHVAEARASGASAVTLHASILDAVDLRNMVSTAQRWRMTTIVQVANEHELMTAAEFSPHVIAIGEGVMFNREHDLPMLQRYRSLIPFYSRLMPFGCLNDLNDVAAVLAVGVDAIVVDETLTRSRPEFEELSRMLEVYSTE
jgi:indole-3-glycerol phosphate synthase